MYAWQLVLVLVVAGLTFFLFLYVCCSCRVTHDVEFRAHLLPEAIFLQGRSNDGEVACADRKADHEVRVTGWSRARAGNVRGGESLWPNYLCAWLRLTSPPQKTEQDSAFDAAGDEEEEQQYSLGADGGGLVPVSSEAAEAPPAELPARFMIKSIWPESYNVNIVLGEKDGTHPQYTLRVAKHGLQQDDGVKARFGAYRDLNNRLTALNNGRPCADNFPLTMSKQQWGFTLSPLEEQKRAQDLNAWLNAVLTSEIDASAAKELVKFLKVSDDRINPTSDFNV